MKTIKEIRQAIESEKVRGAWRRGVMVYALELIEDMGESDTLPESRAEREKALLNGADSWTQYSEGGCSLIYDGDIAKRLCNPSELKKTWNGERNPNGRETWIDVQARALSQAARLIGWLANA
jgi:hypothetical protein